MNKQIHIIGGGTVNHVRPHLALSAPAYGGTARRLAALCRARSERLDVVLHLTKMADHTSSIETNEDLAALAERIVNERRTKIVFMNAAVADFVGTVEASDEPFARLRTSSADGLPLHYQLALSPAPKILSVFRKERKDVFLVAFKATSGATPQEQYLQGLAMLKRVSANLVLANDIGTGLNMIIAPEEARYHETFDRDEVLRELVEMAYLRSHLTFTRSTVVAGEPVPWSSPLVPDALRTVVDHCITRGAYRPVNGSTAGHFAVKLGETTFLTSRRKTNFNQLETLGLVRVETSGPDSVIAYGFKPSVGGQSQRIVFNDHPNTDCIVHVHCEKREGSLVPSVSQREFECGSHECGRNTSNGLTQFGNLYAVHLDNHGPNIVFSKDADPAEVIAFIEANFDLDRKTGGYQLYD